MYKKLLIFWIAVVMLFSVIAFGAGACESYGPNMTELERRIEELERKLGEQAEQLALSEHRASAVAKLRDYAESKRRYDSFARISGVIMSHMSDGMKAISEAADITGINEALTEAKGEIGDVVDLFEERDWEFTDCNNFAIHIWVNNTTLAYGEYLEIRVKMKNLTGMDIEFYFWNNQESQLEIAVISHFYPYGGESRRWHFDWIHRYEFSSRVFFERHGISQIEIEPQRVEHELFSHSCEVIRRFIWFSTPQFWWLGKYEEIGGRVLFNSRINMTITGLECPCWQCS